MAAAVSRTIAPLRENKLIIPEKWEPQARASKEQQWPSLLQCAVVSTAFKILLFPSYHSTDFEVHRNWLAITHSLPVKAWYYEKTSEWTLDYPPAFAAFEWLMSWPASLIDQGMVQISNLGYDSWSTVSYQRGTVIVTELFLVFALHVYASSANSSNRKQAHAIALSILLSPGLLIIDHIHFQYNGFLYGVLILSISLARSQSSMLLSGVLFAVLLCLKHIYLYLAPAYFVYLLRVYCLEPDNVFLPRIVNILKLGASLIAVFGMAFGPFAYWGQLEQLKSRLFPFSRGLCHAYWAPNIWALYSFADRVLIYLAPYLKLSVDKSAISSVTRGLVGDTSFAVLPNITPKQCFGLTLALQSVCWVKLWKKPSWNNFVGAITLCGFASFLVGWHVHEKAILLVLIPFSLVALRDRSYLASFRPLAVAGHVSLFPLIFTVPEFPIKITCTLTWLMTFLYAFSRLAPAPASPRRFLLDRFTLLYMAVAIPLVTYCSLIHRIVFGERYEFIPLMFISTWSAVGVVASWLGFNVCYLTA
jgi:alpha-1,3-glucosyltransferase